VHIDEKRLSLNIDQHTLVNLVDWCLTGLLAQTGSIVPQEHEIYCIGPGGGQDKHIIEQ